MQIIKCIWVLLKPNSSQSEEFLLFYDDKLQKGQYRRRCLSFSPVWTCRACHECTTHLQLWWLLAETPEHHSRPCSTWWYSHRKTPAAKRQNNESCYSKIILDLMHHVHTSHSNVTQVHTQWMQTVTHIPSWFSRSVKGSVCAKCHSVWRHANRCIRGVDINKQVNCTHLQEQETSIIKGHWLMPSSLSCCFMFLMNNGHCTKQ